MKIIGYNYSLDTSKTIKQLDDCAGYCDFNNQVLSVASNLKDDARESVLIHEIIEALNYHMELNLKHNQIMSLESGLYQVLSSSGVDLSVLFSEDKKR